MKKLLLACLVGSAFSVGCSSTSPVPTLVVNNVTSVTTVGSVSPPGGRYLAEINITLANPTPSFYPAWYYYFEIGTGPSGLALSAPTDVNQAVGMPCSFDVDLGPEQAGVVPHYTCNLVFEVPCGETPVVLSYTYAGISTDTPKFAPPACPTGNSGNTGTGGGTN